MVSHLYARGTGTHWDLGNRGFCVAEQKRKNVLLILTSMWRVASHQVKTKFVCGSEDKIMVSFPRGLNDSKGSGPELPLMQAGVGRAEICKGARLVWKSTGSLSQWTALELWPAMLLPWPLVNVFITLILTPITSMSVYFPCSLWGLFGWRK